MKISKFPCPKCNRKGLHYADHPHAFGWKDYDKVECRFCKSVFDAEKIEKSVEKSEELDKSKYFYR